MHMLSFILWVPFFGAVLVALLPTAQHRIIRGLALFHAGLALIAVVEPARPFDQGTAAIQFVPSRWSGVQPSAFPTRWDSMAVPAHGAAGDPCYRGGAVGFIG
jgi:NADH-quinone oxidoreductase subunit M